MPCSDIVTPNHPEEGFMQEVTIAGEVFKIAPRYVEGHVLTENEAAALNQTYFENIRNNMAKGVAEAKEAGAFDLDEFQDRIAAYAEEYVFGARRGPAQPKDPVMAEAFKLAKAAVNKAVVEKYGAKHGYSAEVISDKAREVLGKPTGQKYIDLAKQIVEARQGAASEILAELDPASPAAA